MQIQQWKFIESVLLLWELKPSCAVLTFLFVPQHISQWCSSHFLRTDQIANLKLGMHRSENFWPKPKTENSEALCWKPRPNVIFLCLQVYGAIKIRKYKKVNFLCFLLKPNEKSSENYEIPIKKRSSYVDFLSSFVTRRCSWGRGEAAEWEGQR